MRVPVLKTDRDSFWHRRDPRVKVALFAFLIVLIYLAPSWAWMAGMVGLGALLAITARAPWKWLAVLLLIQVPNVIALVVIPAWSGLASGDFSFDADFQFGLRLALGWIAAVLIGVSLLSTMEIDELTAGLRGIGLPKAFAFMVGYAFVLTYLSASDLLRIGEAARVKGIELRLRHPIRFVRGALGLMIPALFTTVRRGGAMVAALELRGFSLHKVRERPSALKFDWADRAALAAGVLIVAYAGAIRAEAIPAVHPLLDKPSEPPAASPERRAPSGERAAAAFRVAGVYRPTGATPADRDLQKTA